MDWPLGAMLLAATMLTAFACSSEEEEKKTTSGTQGGTVSLEQDDFYFNPTKLSGEVGKPIQVELKNEGKTSHTFTIDALNIDQVLKPDETKTVTVTPKTGGDLAFYCRFHREATA